MHETTENSLDALFTSVDEALELQAARSKDPALLCKVKEFLGNELLFATCPNRPTFYLPRHLATPSYETMHAITLARSRNAELVIGQDQNATFVAHNESKAPLGKLRVVTGHDKNGKPITCKKAIISFSTSNGKRLCEIKTQMGIPLAELHSRLMSLAVADDVRVVEESIWIDQGSRTDIAKQYHKMLAFCCVHAIMLEWFSASETEFGKKVIAPAFEFVRDMIGATPLIVRLIEADMENEQDWDAYPIALLAGNPLLDMFASTRQMLHP